MACFLLVRFSSIGDVLLTTPLIRALRARHPAARLVFVTKAAMAPLVADHPALDVVVTLAPGEPLRALAARLRALHPSRGLDLHGSLRSRALRWLVPCRWRGYRKQKVQRGVLISSKIDLYGRVVPVAERYFAAARGLDVRPDGAPPTFALGHAAGERAERWLGTHGLEDAAFVAVAPGAAHATKQWDPRHWRAVVSGLRAAGYAVVCVGGSADRDVAAALTPAAVSAAGELSLQETGAVLARARAVISGDTGVMHMATGVGTPVVALFGPTVRQFGFFPYQAPALVLQRDLDCRPCSAMGGARCPMGHHRCLDAIAPDEALAAVRRLVA